MARKLGIYLVAAVAGSILTCTLIYASTAPRTVDRISIAAQSPSRDCKELFDLFMADQNDRYPKTGETSVDWAQVELNDQVRREALLRLYAANKLTTGTDYYRGAVIMQHGTTPEDFLVAHEMASASLALGRHGMRWMVAATQDRFLISIGRRQRYGTQYRTDAADLAPALYPVEEGVTDALRKTLDLPSLGEAREKEAAIARLARKGQV